MNHRLEIEANPIARRGLEMYQEWLNRWFASDEWADGSVTQLTWEDWFKYHETKMVTSYDGWYHVVVLECGYGDDGGTAMLTIWGIRNWAAPTQVQEIHAILQEFDTQLQFIYEDGDFTN